MHTEIRAVPDMALKNLGFLGFFKKNLKKRKKSEFRFLKK